MSNLTHLFKIGQKVMVKFDEYDPTPNHYGVVKETYADHIIVDVENVSDHCWFDEDMLDMVYPVY